MGLMGFVVLLSDTFISLPTFPSGSYHLYSGVNSGFGYCRWEYVHMQWEDDSLWESFPQILEMLDAGAQQPEVRASAHLEGLLSVGYTPFNREDASSRRLSKGPFRAQPIKLGRSYPGRGAGPTGGTS